MNKHYLLTVRRVIEETPEAVCIEFEQPKVDRIHYKPGQFITVVAQIGGNAYYRSYSMCSSPKLDDYLAIAVKRVKGGIVSNYLNDHIEEGMAVEVIEPSGSFFIENSVKFHRHVVLIGGGSGITPLLSIARSVLFNEPKSSVSLIYANRNEESIIFREKLEDLTRKFPQRFFLTHFLSQPTPGTQVDFIHGRLDEKKLIEQIKHLPHSDLDTSFYLCGPEALMDMCRACLEKEGIPDDKILSERFFVSPDEVANAYKGDGKIRSVSLKFKGEEYQLDVPSGTSILEVGLSKGLSLPYSCRNGICSTCMAQLNKGEVDMPVREALLDFEIEKGKILLCQAHPVTEDVEVEV